MVQMNKNNSECEPKPVKLESQTLLKKFDIPLDHLDFKYLENCKNRKEIEQILQILRSGEEGYFPDLLTFTEKRLFEINPRSKLLQCSVPVLSKYDICKDEWQELNSDLQNWIEDVNKNDKELSTFQDIKPNTNNIPIRESKTQRNRKTEKKSERIRSMDYESWDKLDVDTEILKMDIKDEKIKEKALKKTAEKEKLNTIVLDTDLMTKAELNHAALQAKNAGNECYKSGDYEEALQYYTNSLIFAPTPIVYNNRAITNIKLKHYVDAIKDCNEILKTEKGNVKAHLRKSTAYKCLKQYEKAIETLEILIQINPNCIDAQNMIRDIKKLSGNNEKVKTVRMTIHDEHNENQNIQNTKEENNRCKNKSTSTDTNKYNDIKIKNEHKNTEIKEIEEEYTILDKNVNDENIKTEMESESRENVFLPIPSTSKFSGPFYRVVNVPSDIVKKITNTKKTHSKSDENVIDLNLPENSTRKKIPKSVENGKICQPMKNESIAKKIATEMVPEIESFDISFTPYEFLKYWQAIKNDPTLQEHEQLLRSLTPSDLVKVLGNKLDGEMFSILLKCLESRFTQEEDITFIANILIELQKIPRIGIIMLLMNDNDKNIIRSLITRITNYGYNFRENTFEMYNRVIKN